MRSTNGWTIGVETHFDPDDYDSDVYDDDYEALSIEESLQNTLTFWKALGYEISIKEKKSC